jgi:import inner membrane translocase subunit TIM22
MARGFALAGGVFVACECVIEKKRGKSDIFNPVLGGCAAGAALSARAGPQAMALGCVGFSAFSTIIELVMNNKD